jgi:hypothetical protein
MLVVGLGYGYWSVRHRKEEKAAADALKYAILGLWNYNDAHGCLPTPALFDDDGNPRASWRFLICNYIEATNWYIPDETKPWIRPDKTEIDLHATAESASLFTFWETSARGATRIAAITGPGSAFDEDNRCSFAQIDGDTIVLAEVANTDVPWTEPGDYTWQVQATGTVPAGSMKIGNAKGQAFHVGFQNGDVWALAAETPLSDVSRFFTVKGARENDRETILGRWRR